MPTEEQFQGEASAEAEETIWGHLTTDAQETCQPFRNSTEGGLVEQDLYCVKVLEPVSATHRELDWAVQVCGITAKTMAR